MLREQQQKKTASKTNSDSDVGDSGELDLSANWRAKSFM
jgi:hypothetical protein